MAIEAEKSETKSGVKPSVPEKTGKLFTDLEGEMERETQERPDTSQSDVVLRTHVNGIWMLMLGLVVLMLLGGIAFIAMHGPIHMGK